MDITGSPALKMKIAGGVGQHPTGEGVIDGVEGARSSREGLIQVRPLGVRHPLPNRSVRHARDMVQDSVEHPVRCLTQLRPIVGIQRRLRGAHARILAGILGGGVGSLPYAFCPKMPASTLSA